MLLVVNRHNQYSRYFPRWAVVWISITSRLSAINTHLFSPVQEGKSALLFWVVEVDLDMIEIITAQARKPRRYWVCWCLLVDTFGLIHSNPNNPV